MLCSQSCESILYRPWNTLKPNFAPTRCITGFISCAGWLGDRCASEMCVSFPIHMTVWEWDWYNREEKQTAHSQAWILWRFVQTQTAFPFCLVNTGTLTLDLSCLGHIFCSICVSMFQNKSWMPCWQHSFDLLDTFPYRACYGIRCSFNWIITLQTSSSVP